MRKFLVTVVTSEQTEIVKAGQQFEVVEDNSYPNSDIYINVTGVINGMYLSAYVFNTGSIVFPAVLATFTAKELDQ